MLTKQFEDGTTYGPKEFGIAFGLAAVGATVVYGSVAFGTTWLWNRRAKKIKNAK